MLQLFKSSPIAREPRCTHLFMHLNADANKENGQIIKWRKRNIELKRGQMFLNGRSYASQIGIPHNRYIECMKILKEEGFIDYLGSRLGTIVSILNYEDFGGRL